ncbi:MMPL family transporter, partial [candidate division WOR-3 bacterium]|nr:MMPL family transporter [candidate division WOR-3 bacterium]
MEKDMQKFFPLSMLLVAVVLFLIFRNLSSIIFPLITVFLGLVWTLGLKGMVNSPITPISTTLFALITVIGIANSVHLISHFRIEISVIKDKKRALMETYYRAGKPCLFTSLTTAMGFGSLSISNIPAIRNLGIFAGFGIMSVFMLSMILVPLGLLLIKTSPKVTGKQAHKGMENLLKRIGGFNLKCSKLIIIFGFLIVLIMITGIPRIHVEGSMMQYLKEGSRLRKDAEFFDRNLTGISSTEVIIRGDQDLFKNPAVLKKIDGLQKLVENHPKVSCSYSLVDYIKLINRALNNGNNTHYTIPETQEAIAQSLLLYEMSGGTEIDEYVTIDYDMARISMRTNQMNEKERKVLLTTVQTYINKNFKKINTEITGLDNMVHKVTERIVSTQIQSLGLAFLVILGLMLLLFGLRGGLVSVLPNMFPIVFVLGFMGYAGFSLNIATAIIASIAIGIVVDDTIHYFSHFRHEFEITGNREQSMKNALQKVGRALCFTSLILVLGFAIFLLSETRILMDYGILSGIAVIMALLGDLFIGPVLLTKLRVFKK